MKITNKYILEIIKKRNIKDVEKFLNPSLKNIPSFAKLFDSKTAAKKIIKYAKEGKKIFIHGDYDADGICATAILWEYLFYDLSKTLEKKIDVVPYIPDRVDQGYGLSESSLNSMIEQGAQVIITVDCGIRDRERIEKYISKELDIIVTDHHQPSADIIDAKYTIVHPMFPNKQYPHQEICGSLVSLLLTLALAKEVGKKGDTNKETKGLDLAALATVTDMMPLLGINRDIVVFGLKQLQKNSRLGVTALTRLSSTKLEELDSYHLGFVIGPRINAAGRIGKAIDALKLILSPNEKTAVEYSSILYNLNTLRQTNTTEILEQIEAVLPQYESDSLIFIHGQGWHEGVIGLAASKIFERFHKPVVITTLNGNEIKGSARSISSFNITFAIEKFSKHLTKYGGHAQAAGFSTTPEQLDEFRKKLVAFANKNITSDLLEHEIDIDVQIPAWEIDLELIEQIDLLKPFGYGNPKPMVKVVDLKILKVIFLSNRKHLKLLCENNISLMFFNIEKQELKFEEGEIIEAVGNLNINEWNGKKEIQLQVKEWKAYN